MTFFALNTLAESLAGFITRPLIPVEQKLGNQPPEGGDPRNVFAFSGIGDKSVEQINLRKAPDESAVARGSCGSKVIA